MFVNAVIKPTLGKVQNVPTQQNAALFKKQQCIPIKFSAETLFTSMK